MKEKHNIPKQSGFKVPNQYLENFKVDFSHANTNPSLDKIESAGFKTPDNYFNDFKVEIPSENKKSKVISLYRNQFFTVITTAAAVLLFIVLIYKEKTVEFSETTELNQLAIENYLEQNDFDFENEIDYNSDAYFISIKKELNTVGDEAIIEYLAQSSDMDIASLLNDY